MLFRTWVHLQKDLGLLTKSNPKTVLHRRARCLARSYVREDASGKLCDNTCSTRFILGQNLLQICALFLELHESARALLSKIDESTPAKLHFSCLVVSQGARRLAYAAVLGNYF